MRLKFSVAMAALALSVPAQAVQPPPPPPTVVDACTAAFLSGAVACQGYYGSNYINGAVGSSTDAEVQGFINLLLNGTAATNDALPTNNTGLYTPPYVLDTSQILGSITGLNGSATFNFGSLMLSGWTVVGAHFGNNIDSDVNNVTAFWLVDVGAAPTNTITLSNGMGSSNAQIFATGAPGAVPEPSTWAMMLMGFGAVGFATRRQRRKTRLNQLA